MKYKLPVLLLCFSSIVLADQCPTPEQIRDRTISRDYDWSVSEDVTLDMLLEISNLNKVSVHNHGEFVACYYQSQQLLVRMDGTALTSNCFVTNFSGEWLPLSDGTLSCTEAELMNCRFQIECIE